MINTTSIFQAYLPCHLCDICNVDHVLLLEMIYSLASMTYYSLGFPTDGSLLPTWLPSCTPYSPASPECVTQNFVLRLLLIVKAIDPSITSNTAPKSMLKLRHLSTASYWIQTWMSFNSTFLIMENCLVILSMTQTEA